MKSKAIKIVALIVGSLMTAYLVYWQVTDVPFGCMMPKEVALGIASEYNDNNAQVYVELVRLSRSCKPVCPIGYKCDFPCPFSFHVDWAAEPEATPRPDGARYEYVHVSCLSGKIRRFYEVNFRWKPASP